VNVRPSLRPLVSLLALPLVGLAFVLLAPSPPPRALWPAGGSAAPAGALLGAVLFVSLARGRRRTARVRSPAALAAGLALATAGAGEEAVWRGFALARLAPSIGVAGALAATTVAFAVTHVPALRVQAAVHLVTGTAFGLVFVASGSLLAAALAHGSYNLLVVLFRVPGRLAWAAELRGVEKRFGAVSALRGVDLALAPGEVVALLGPNGAGKTTLVSILLGLRRPDAGTAEVFGRNPRRWRSRVAVGTTPQEMSFPPTLRVGEVLAFGAAHFQAHVSVLDLLRRFGLEEVAGRQTGGLSGGQRRRLAVALAFVGEPRLLVLDEPTSGLDVESRRDVWDTIRSYAAGGGTALLTTHSLEEAAALAGRVVVLADGVVVADGEPAAIVADESAFLRLTRCPA
jgi:ABC-2 type transport system ATP-binding protein